MKIPRRRMAYALARLHPALFIGRPGETPGERAARRDAAHDILQDLLAEAVTS